MSASTTIIIPGRATQTIAGLVMTKSDVISAYAGDIDLSGMISTEEKEGDSVTITFANRTGTKGSDIVINGDVNINVGDVTVNNTRIEIPGREAMNIQGLVMKKEDVISAYAGDIDLGGMSCSEEEIDGTMVFSFANRTGTKGQQDIIQVIIDAVNKAQRDQEIAAQEDEDEDEDEDEFFDDEDEEDYEEVVNTLIRIPGREAQVINGMVLDAEQVRASFSGDIDLSSYSVTEEEFGDTMEITFQARTGTKG